MRAIDARSFRSPSCGSRGVEKVTLLVLHYTGMPSAEEALVRLCDPKAKVSAHYLVDERGGIFALVEESEAAWHAGASSWHGRRNVNDVSIGIEIVNPGHEWGYRPFPPAQIEAVAELAIAVIGRHPIEARNVVAHSDVAPGRKHDPGELFNWEFLADRGVGLWPRTEEKYSPQKTLTAGDTGEKVSQMQECLARYGYELPQGGLFDDPTRQAVVAFQRHFRPRDIGGEWDKECAGRLSALLALVE